MDVFLIISFVFLISLVFYAINLFLPDKSRLKYYISLCFGIIGFISWAYVWVGKGWLTSAVVGTLFLLLSVISLAIAFIQDFIFRRKKGEQKNI